MELRPSPDGHDDADAGTPTHPTMERVRAPALLAGPPFTVGDLLRRTWSIYQARLSTCMAAYWGSAAASWLILLTVSLTLSGINDLVRDPVFFDFLRFLLFLADVVVPAWLQIGLNLAMLKIARQEPAAFEDLFRGGRYLLTTLLASLLLLAIAGVPAMIVYGLADLITPELKILTTLLAAVPVLVAAGAPDLILDGIVNLIISESNSRIILVILGFLGGVGLGSAVVLGVLVRLGQLSYVVLDQGAGVLESLQGSWRLTRGRIASVVLVYLLYLAINAAGLLACCVGLFFTLPLTSLLLAMTYQALSEGLPGFAPSHPGTWEEDDAG